MQSSRSDTSRTRSPARSRAIASPEALLEAGLAELGLGGNPDLATRCLAYLRLLERWNRVYNLTAIRDLHGMVTRHLLDSLVGLPFIEGSEVLDVGSGAGLPGIPLALARPQLNVTLIDARGRKTRFLQHAVEQLQLTNVRVVNARVEDLQAPPLWDTVTARAFAGLPDLIASAGHLCRHGAAVVSYKGRRPDAELQALEDPAFRVEKIEPVNVPGLDAPRHVVVLRAIASR